MFDAHLYVSVRALHVLFAIFWAGAILFIMIFLDPATREAGPAGGQVMGILLSVGMLAGVLTLGIGFFGSRPTARTIGEVAARMVAGCPPAPQDAAEMARLRGSLKLYLRAAGTMLLLAVLAMAWGSHG
jgi:hypothetical protein